MADPTEPLPPAAPAAPEPAAVVVETPAVPGVDTAPAAEPIDHTTTPSLLESFTAPAETVAELPAATEPAVTTDTKPAVDAPATTEAAPPAEPPAPAEPVTYPEWKLPETFLADKTALEGYTNVLAEFGVKPEAGQKLLDMHAAVLQQGMAQYAAQLQAEQHRAFAEVRKDWATQAKADPEIGGAGHQTAMGVVARMRDLLVSSHKSGTEEYKQDMAELDQFLRITGAGDHPIFLKMLYRAGRYLDEPAMPPANVRPSPSNGQAPRRLRDTYQTMTK